MTESETWGTMRKLLFRFSCIYFLWYALPGFITPGYRWGEHNYITHAMDRMAIWIGRNVLKLGYEVRIEPTGSGDTTALYIHMLIMLAGSVAGCLVWTMLDRNRPHYRGLSRWLVVALRYYLMSVMLAYGFAKVFTSQFPPPSLTRLLQTYGDSSPMGLLWISMGFSRPYTVFAGLGEVVGGLLMGLRRTTTLGALIIVAVMSNVVMMNFSYDVPVKLYSSHILLFALVLVALDGRRVLSLLVLNRPFPAADDSPHFTSPRGQLIARVVKTLVVAFFLFGNISNGLMSERALGPSAPKPPLWGIYDVESFVIDGETLPPLTTETRRWQNVVFDTRGQLGVRMMDGRIERFTFVVEGRNQLSVYQDREGDSFARHAWTYARPTPQSLHMESEIDGRSVVLEMKARDVDDFLLLSRGFRWVSEEPFDR